MTVKEHISIFLRHVFFEENKNDHPKDMKAFKTMTDELLEKLLNVNIPNNVHCEIIFVLIFELFRITTGGNYLFFIQLTESLFVLKAVKPSAASGCAKRESIYS